MFSHVFGGILQPTRNGWIFGASKAGKKWAPSQFIPCFIWDSPIESVTAFPSRNLGELIESLWINLYDLYGWWYFFWWFNQMKNHHQIERVINHQPSTNQPSGNHQPINLYKPLSHVSCRLSNQSIGCKNQESQPDSGQRDWRSAALARGTGPSAVEKSAGSFHRGNPLTQSSSEFHQISPNFTNPEFDPPNLGDYSCVYHMIRCISFPDGIPNHLTKCLRNSLCTWRFNKTRWLGRLDLIFYLLNTIEKSNQIPFLISMKQSQKP